MFHKHIILVFPRDTFYQFTTCIEDKCSVISYTDGTEDAHIASLETPRKAHRAITNAASSLKVVVATDASHYGIVNRH